jgi:putative transposase
MKRKRYTEEQIVCALKQAENGSGVAELCRTMGVSEATFYNWRKKYKGLGVAEVRELRMLREENRKRELADGYSQPMAFPAAERAGLSN